MTARSDAVKTARKTSIRELLHTRTQVAEKLAGALDDYEAARAAVATAQRAAADRAAAARRSYQDAIDAGWTATELIAAGLKPPAQPRKRADNAAEGHGATDQ